MAARQINDAHSVPPGSILLVVHDFIARSPDELTLAKGDRIELIERDDDFGDGWFLGKHMGNGNTGLFPEVYTTPASKGTLAATAATQAAANQAQRRPASEDHKYSAEPKQNNVARYSADSIATHKPPTAFSPTLQSPATANAQPSLRISQPPPTSPNQVMTETLSVIDEHITDMHTPRQSHLAIRPLQSRESTIYGSDADRRSSYINGHETDEEEQQGRSETEVASWSPEKVAEYLEDVGVEAQHCNIFREQEISGEVLLAMEQSAIFIKEFELGSVGRRLKTWQKVKALQDEVRAATYTGVPRSVSDYGDDHAESGRARSASASNSQFLGMSMRTVPANRSSAMPFPNGSPSPSATPAPARPESTVRPSAQSIRSMNHTRRHSSIGSTASMRDLVTSREAPSHRKTPSMDHTWSMSGENGFTRRASGYSPGKSGLENNTSTNDLDRGYFSGNEADNKRSNRRSVLQKKSVVGATHSRTPSEATDAEASNSQNASAKMDSPLSPMMASTSGFGRMRGIRSVSSPKALGKPYNTFDAPSSPVVTKLEYGQAPGSPASSSMNQSPSAGTHSFSFWGKPKTTGHRIASDAVTQSEKAGLAKQSAIASPVRTGSTTPSTETHSFDNQKSEPSRLSTGSSQNVTPTTPVIPPTARPRPVARTKQATSAYTRGLEKKGPVEQIAGCDYSGWMKKKSTGLVGSWKPRLFVLRGRRLSYYYSENDTEEKGLIDISNHRVLPAENEKMTGLHATLTGAASATSPGLGSSLQTTAGADRTARPSPNPQADAGLFIFKLVPPRQGLSKAVNFTKPMVHYFAVNSRQEGRLWMAALMKATIDYDSSGKVITSYNQETISLAKARSRMERPPALQEGDDSQDGASAGDQQIRNGTESQGLGIGGLDQPSEPTEDALGGAEHSLRDQPDRGSAGLDSLAESLRNKEAAALIS
ncbi:hypothetical protein MBLNU457_g0184t1 [Dothideomycetes sp. NU457]